MFCGVPGNPKKYFQVFVTETLVPEIVHYSNLEARPVHYEKLKTFTAWKEHIFWFILTWSVGYNIYKKVVSIFPISIRAM